MADITGIIKSISGNKELMAQVVLVMTGRRGWNLRCGF